MHIPASSCHCHPISSQNTRSVSVLNSDRRALTYERRRAWLFADFRNPSSDLPCLLSPYARRFDDERNKVDTSDDVHKLGVLAEFCRRRCRPSLCTAGMDHGLLNGPCMDVRHSEGVGAYGDPRKTSTSLPRHLCHSVRSLSTAGAQRVWLTPRHAYIVQVPVLGLYDEKARQSRSLSWLCLACRSNC